MLSVQVPVVCNVGGVGLILRYVSGEIGRFVAGQVARETITGR